MLDLNISYWQYDIGIAKEFDESYYDKFFEFDRTALRKNGHLEYILKIYSDGKLLDNNAGQGYHPPLSHLISAGFIKILDLCGASNKFKIEALEFPPLIYSILIIFVAYKIMKELGLNNKQIIIPFSFLNFYPLFIYMSRQINNDELVTLLSLLSVLYLLKWYKNQTYKNTIILGLSIGLAGMTKTSVIVMALPLFFTYLKKINESLEDRKLIKKILIQGLIFSLISIPLLFWYQVRNAIKFDQPTFGIVTALDTLKVEKNGFIDRWLINKEIFVHNQLDNASNVFSYAINSTLSFAIEIYIIPELLISILVILTIMLIGIGFIGFLKKDKINDNKSLWQILNITNLAWIIGYIVFNIILPYSCTMHSRYIMISIIIGMMYIEKCYFNVKNPILKNIIVALIVLFEMLSILLVIWYILAF